MKCNITHDLQRYCKKSLQTNKSNIAFPLRYAYVLTAKIPIRWSLLSVWKPRREKLKVNRGVVRPASVMNKRRSRWRKRRLQSTTTRERIKTTMGLIIRDVLRWNGSLLELGRVDPPTSGWPSRVSERLAAYGGLTSISTWASHGHAQRLVCSHGRLARGHKSAGRENVYRMFLVQ